MLSFLPQIILMAFFRVVNIRFKIVFSAFRRLTNPTNSFITLADPCIFFAKRVTPNTMRFSRVHARKTLATPKVLFSRYRLKMIGVYTRTISAQMVYLQPGGYRPFFKFVSEAVRENSVIVKHELAISRTIVDRPENPTIYFFVKGVAFPNIFGFVGLHSNYIPCVVSESRGGE